MNDCEIKWFYCKKLTITEESGEFLKYIQEIQFNGKAPYFEAKLNFFYRLEQNS